MVGLALQDAHTATVVPVLAPVTADVEPGKADVLTRDVQLGLYFNVHYFFTLFSGLLLAKKLPSHINSYVVIWELLDLKAANTLQGAEPNKHQ